MPRREPLHVRRVRAAAVALLAVGLVAAATPPRRASPAASFTASRADSALVAEVRALNAAMVAALERGDLAGVARFYADDARIVGPGRETVRGRAAIDAYWTGLRSARRWRLEVVEVGGSRAEAYEIGVSSLTSAGPGGAERTYVCDFVVIWKRQPDGTLRIALDLYT